MTSTESTSGASSVLRTAFGVVLFIAWGLATILWVYDAFHSLADGDPAPVIKAIGAILLMLLLMGMEGLEVAVIDRWRELYPDRSSTDLGGWLAARQLFVALIVTAATLLAERESIAIPGISAQIDAPVALKVFNLLWTTLTVLWFMQIFPKLLAATNPNRYLKLTQGSLFPIVEVVRKIGVSQPGEWVARATESRLNWYPEPSIEEAPPRRGPSLTDAWAALIPDSPPPSRPQPPENRTAGPTGS
jgi:hypothetical protein